MATFKGSCLCGAVTYVSEGEPIFCGACHCTSCQKFSGTAFSMMQAMPKAGFKVLTGALTTYNGVGDSGKATHRRFCSTCGCTVSDEADIIPHIVMIPVGTLENPAAIAPQVHVYWKHHCAWVETLMALPKFETMPPH